MAYLIDLRTRFVRVVESLMVARGWDRDPAADDMTSLISPTLGMFQRPRDGDFCAEVSFELETFEVGRSRHGALVSPPVLVVSLQAGLRYLPADRVQRLLGGFSSQAEIDLRAVAGPAAQTGEMSDLAAVDEGAGQLVDAVDRYVLATVDQYLDIDAFMGLFRWASPELEPFMIPTILGAGGRTAEARARLEQTSELTVGANEREDYTRYAARLTAWLDAGAIVPDESALPPPVTSRLPPDDPEDWMPDDLDKGEERRRRQNAKRKAVASVRQAGGNLSRAERQKLLLDEAAARHIDADPIWVQTTLDVLDMDLTQGEVLRSLGGLLMHTGRMVFSALRVPEQAGEDEPAWMTKPPNTWRRSVHHVARSIAIDLDEDATGFIARVFETSPYPRSKLVGVQRIDVWLAWAPAPRTDRSVLAVHIGPQKVGTVPQADQDAYVPIIDSVQPAEMWPIIMAKLARLTSGAFILQIPLSGDR